MSNKFDAILGKYRQDDATNAVKLDQSTPQTFTAGAVTGTGVLVVTAGQLGLEQKPLDLVTVTYFGAL